MTDDQAFGVFTAAIADVHHICGTDPQRDLLTAKRIYARGLPALCKMCKEYEDGYLNNIAKRHGDLPRFLRDVPVPMARAVVALLAKFDNGLAASDPKLWDKLWFAKVEREKAMASTRTPSNILSDLATFGRRFFKDLPVDLLPRFSGGAVAERFSPLEKYTSRTWGFTLHELDSSYRVPLGMETVRHAGLPARFWCVPKDATKLRPISIEPAHRIYIQHALRRHLLKMVDTEFTLRQGIPYRDQSVNAELCKNQEYATIDLTNASDSVRCSHVYSLFSSQSQLRRLLFEARSGCIRYDAFERDYSLNMTSYAGMGNATTFMVESLVFYAIAYMALEKYRNSPYESSARLAQHNLRVYGDDIVVHSAYAVDVLNALRSAGYQPNMNKTFVVGPFRESCGAEWLNAIDCRVPRIRGSDNTSAVPYSVLVSRLRYWGFNNALRQMFDLLRGNPFAQWALFGRSSADVIFRYRKEDQNLLVRVRTETLRKQRLDPRLGLHRYLSEGTSEVFGRPKATVGWAIAYALMGDR